MKIKNIFLSNWPLIIILILSAILRLLHIDQYLEFLGDQGRDVVIVRDFLKNANFFFIGPQTSIGNMYLGPYYYYFIAPALLVANFSPIGPAVFVALLSVLTVYLIYKFVSRWFTTEIGLVSALFFAVSPVVVKYSSFSWNPNILPLFSLLFIYFLTERKYILASLSFIMCLNSHYLSLLLLFPALAILVVKYQKTDLKKIFIALLIFILSFIPQVLFDIKHQGQNSQAFITFFSKRETTVNLKAYKAIPKLPQLFNQVSTRILAGKNASLGFVVSIVFFILIILSLKKQFKSIDNNNYYYLMLIWFFSGLVGLALYKQHIYDHYFGFIYPAICIMFSLVLSLIPKYPRYILIIILTVYSISQNQIFYPAPNTLGTTKKITDSIISAANQNPFNFALLAKMNYDPGYIYFLTSKNYGYFHLREKITDQLFVVCEPFQIDCEPINNPEWGVAAFGWAKIDSEWEINGIKIYRLIPNPDGQKI